MPISLGLSGEAGAPPEQAPAAPESRPGEGGGPGRPAPAARADSPSTLHSPARRPDPAPREASSVGDTPTDRAELEARTARIAREAASAPDLGALAERVAACTACALSAGRTQTVFMDGTAPARVMFVGEAPGFHEDRTGTPFVGPAGKLLTDIVTKGMGLDRSEVVIANVLKCRPPENRDPAPAEKQLCTGWLDRQIELVNPEVVIALGRHAAGHLLGTEDPLGRLRGRVWSRNGRRVVVTYHPAFLLRSPHMKKECWADIQVAMAELGLERPDQGGSGSPGNRAPGGR